MQQYINDIRCDENDILSIEAAKAKKGEMLTADVIDLLHKLLAQDEEKNRQLSARMDELQSRLDETVALLAASAEQQKAQQELQRASEAYEDSLPQLQ